MRIAISNIADKYILKFKGLFHAWVPKAIASILTIVSIQYFDTLIRMIEYRIGTAPFRSLVGRLCTWFLPQMSLNMHRWLSFLKLSRRRNGFLVLFTLILINLSIFHEYLLPHRLVTPEGLLPNFFHNGSDDTHSFNTVLNRNSSRILLVSSLFHISKSKHSVKDYHKWLQRFLRITTEVYFYTSSDLVPTVQSARGEGLPITIDTTYNTSFDIPPLKGFEGWYNEMHSMDREKSLHSPELYSIWNAKPFFVDNAIRVMASKGKTYDYVFWNDAGSFREISTYKNWPDPSRIDEIWQEGSRLSGTKAEDLLFFPIQEAPHKARNWKEDMGPIDCGFSEGEHAVSFSFSPLR